MSNVINREKYFDSAKFLKADDFKKGETVVKIEAFEEVTTRLGLRPLLRLKGYEMPLGLNATNIDALIKKYGDDSDKWKGKTLTVYKVKTTDPSQGGKEVDGLRIK